MITYHNCSADPEVQNYCISLLPWKTSLKSFQEKGDRYAYAKPTSVVVDQALSCSDQNCAMSIQGQNHTPR